MIILDEEKLTYGTIMMIGQDLGIEGEKIMIEEYANKVIDILKNGVKKCDQN